jgi:hypothetical protein
MVVDTSQVDRFAQRLNTTPSPLVEEAWRREWSVKVAAEMRNLAPSLTGALKASIQPNDDGVIVGVPYGAYVEYGTGDTPPQPYALPATVKLVRPAAADAANRVIRDI